MYDLNFIFVISLVAFLTSFNRNKPLVSSIYNYKKLLILLAYHIRGKIWEPIVALFNELYQHQQNYCNSGYMFYTFIMAFRLILNLISM